MNGIAESTIEAAQKSPVYKFVKVWKLALPLHPEFRTLPNCAITHCCLWPQ
ncbi:MAG: hypothetical protein R2847_10175 [Bacteroidia bacterium]